MAALGRQSPPEGLLGGTGLCVLVACWCHLADFGGHFGPLKNQRRPKSGPKNLIRWLFGAVARQKGLKKWFWAGPKGHRKSIGNPSQNGAICRGKMAKILWKYVYLHDFGPFQKYRKIDEILKPFWDQKSMPKSKKSNFRRQGRSKWRLRMLFGAF